MNILKSIQRTPFEWIELEQDFCANVYASAPCAAILGTTGADKCYNTRASCQDVLNYDGSEKLTLRFCANRGQIPDDYYYLPYLQGVQVSAATINPGGGNENMAALGTRATLSVSLSDHPHTDRNVDPYLDDRNFIAFDRSTFWAKWRARNPYYMHRVIRHKSGFIDPVTQLPDPATLITRTFFITGFTGPDNDGNVSINAMDVLTLAANEKAKAPRPSSGKLLTAITAAATSATLTPLGIGAEYPAAGKLRIDGEIVSFTRSGDVLTIARALNNTNAADHSINATVQLCIEYLADSPKDILQDLLVNYASVPIEYLDLAQWAIESADFLPRLYSAIITEPMGVTELIGEMCEQMYFTTFWDERKALLKMRAVRPAENETITYLNDESNILEDSITWNDRPDQLITQVWIYYGQRNPTDSTTDARNFGALDVVADTDAENPDRNGLTKIKIIFSRWLQGSDGATAIELGQKILDRYNEIPKECSFSVDAKDRDLWLADFISMTNRSVVDFTGSPRSIPMQVVSAQESLQGTIYSYKAMEYSGDSEISTPNDFSIAFSTDYINVNLREIFEEKYSVVLVPGMSVKFTVRSGVTIGGSPLDANNVEVFNINQNVSYTSLMRFANSNFNDAITYSNTLREFPFIGRRGITEIKLHSKGAPYFEPDTGLDSGFLCGQDVKEYPLKPALVTGDWPVGVNLELVVEAGAAILGSGGCGGSHLLYTTGTGSGEPNNAVRAGDGGDALEITAPITINNLGIIGGGGGGGELLSGFGGDAYETGDPLDPVNGFADKYIPGGGGAGYLNPFLPTVFLWSHSENLEINLPVDGITETQPGGAEKIAPGVAGTLKYKQVLFIFPMGTAENISGAGGELATIGGTGQVFTKDAAGNLVPGLSSNLYNRPGLPGYAILDGKELITWFQKGDVRGAEF